MTIINPGFETISRVPRNITVPKTVVWNSKAKDVKKFKRNIKRWLRYAQDSRCCFCRRPLNQQSLVDLEHFIEKSIDNSLVFQVTNIFLSCKDCNNSKAAVFNTNVYKSNANSVPALHVTFVNNHTYNVNDYRYVNPRQHRYSDHIQINKCWIYIKLTAIGICTVDELEFNKISNIESKLMRERLSRPKSIAGKLVSALAEAPTSNLNAILKELIGVIRKKKTLALKQF